MRKLPRSQSQHPLTQVTCLPLDAKHSPSRLISSMAVDTAGALSQLFKDLTLGAQCKHFAEYVWIGAGCDLHSKTRVLDFKPSCVEQLPPWHFDDSSQTDSCRRVHLRPCRMFPDPFRDGGNVLVLCETLQQGSHPDQTGSAHPANTRSACATVMESAAPSAPVFSAEQQYTLLGQQSQWPLGERHASRPGC